MWEQLLTGLTTPEFIALLILAALTGISIRRLDNSIKIIDDIQKGRVVDQREAETSLPVSRLSITQTNKTTDIASENIEMAKEEKLDNTINVEI